MSTISPAAQITPVAVRADPVERSKGPRATSTVPAMQAITTKKVKKMARNTDNPEANKPKGELILQRPDARQRCGL